MIKNFLQAILAGIGTFWMFVEAYKNLQNDNVEISFIGVVLIGGLFGLIWFFIEGYLIDGYLKRKITIKSNAIDIRIDILFGDIFKQKGYKAIGVNEYFDSAVDSKHVSENSLHGEVISNYWKENHKEWDDKVTEELRAITPVEIVENRQPPGKKNKYSIGTTAKTNIGVNKFLCVVLSKTNTKTLQVSADSGDLQKALRGLLSKAREVCGGEVLNLPLLGSGLSKTGIKLNIIVDLILLAVFEESKKEKITENIRIILPKKLCGQINLTNIHEDWR